MVRYDYALPQAQLIDLLCPALRRSPASTTTSNTAVPKSQRLLYFPHGMYFHP